ncbi:AI-2E family transporter [Gemmata sp.]|uniref:AI-2E family transporter n=1 Tax=Gemmata sp. TaxID=1914242 RepID=UPI003F70683A
MDANGDRRPEGRQPDDVSRGRARTAALVALTLIGLTLCVLVAYPFLPALAWAVALAVIVFPIHARVAKVIPNANWAAGVSTAAVVAIILVPVLLLGAQLGREAADAATRAEALAREGRVDAAIDKVSHGRESLEWVRRNVDPEAEARRLITPLTGGATALARGSAWFAVQFLVCVFVLFFAFRDWRHLLAAVEDLSPLAREESDYLFTRVSDSIHATVYATVVTSVFQGLTGGLLFWAVGLPAPVLWGVVMTILGIIPLVGAFLVWVPAALALALDEWWGAAAGIVAWGLLMAGPVGNWLYAHLAGGRMRLHPVPVLIAFVGGLAVFGVSGMVLGPVILAVTMGLIDVWRRRLRSTATPAGSPEPPKGSDRGAA